ADPQLRQLGAVLLRGGAQPVAAVARSDAGRRGADRGRRVSARRAARPPPLARALLQPAAPHPDARGRPLRADGGAGALGRRHSRVLSPPARLTVVLPPRPVSAMQLDSPSSCAVFSSQEKPS